MEIIHIPHSLSHFLFMGCWNKDGCVISPGQKAVAKAIRKEPADWPLFLGGDNIYPDKHNERKIYPPSRVEEGVSCLIADSPRAIFATLGNHNIEKADVLEAELALGLWTIRQNSYCIQFRDRAVILLNSNSLDNGTLEEEGREVLEALESVLGYLKKAHIPYILLMHHPLIALKKKAYYIMPQHAEVLDRLVTYPPQMVLVADTHNYQQGLIEWRGAVIRQIVVGTGGANLDPILYADRTVQFGSGAYTVGEAKVVHGYIRVSGEVVEFVNPVSSRSP